MRLESGNAEMCSVVEAICHRMTFGALWLGDALAAGSLEIHWPFGAKETVKLPAVDASTPSLKARHYGRAVQW